MHERLETDRLVLRMFGNEDLDAYHAILTDPQVMEFIGDGKTITRLEAWRALASSLGHWTLRGYGAWAVEERQSQKLVGRVGFINPEGWPGLELGWLLAPEFWGYGYATEASRAALQYGWSTFGFARVISLIHPQNGRSIRVAKRLGAVEDGETELLGRSVLVYAHSPVG